MKATGSPLVRQTPEEAIAWFRKRLLVVTVPLTAAAVALLWFRSVTLFGSYRWFALGVVVVAVGSLLAVYYFLVAPRIGRIQARLIADERR